MKGKFIVAVVVQLDKKVRIAGAHAKAYVYWSLIYCLVQELSLITAYLRYQMDLLRINSLKFSVAQQ